MSKKRKLEEEKEEIKEVRIPTSFKGFIRTEHTNTRGMEIQIPTMDYAAFLVNPKIRFTVPRPLKTNPNERIRVVGPINTDDYSLQSLVKGISNETFAARIQRLDDNHMKMIEKMKEVVAKVKRFNSETDEDVKEGLALEISYFISEEGWIFHKGFSKLHVFIADEMLKYVLKFKDVVLFKTCFSEAKKHAAKRVRMGLGESLEDLYEMTFLFIARRYKGEPYNEEDMSTLSAAFAIGPSTRAIMGNLFLLVNPCIVLQQHDSPVYGITDRGTNRIHAMLHNQMYIFLEALSIGNRHITDAINLPVALVLLVLQYAVFFDS